MLGKVEIRISTWKTDSTVWFPLEVESPFSRFLLYIYFRLRRNGYRKTMSLTRQTLMLFSLVLQDFGHYDEDLNVVEHYVFSFF